MSGKNSFKVEEGLSNSAIISCFLSAVMLEVIHMECALVACFLLNPIVAKKTQLRSCFFPPRSIWTTHHWGEWKGCLDSLTRRNLWDFMWSKEQRCESLLCLWSLHTPPPVISTAIQISRSRTLLQPSLLSPWKCFALCKWPTFAPSPRPVCFHIITVYLISIGIKRALHKALLIRHRE